MYVCVDEDDCIGNNEHSNACTRSKLILHPWKPDADNRRPSTPRLTMLLCTEMNLENIASVLVFSLGGVIFILTY